MLENFRFWKDHPEELRTLNASDLAKLCQNTFDRLQAFEEDEDIDWWNIDTTDDVEEVLRVTHENLNEHLELPGNLVACVKDTNPALGKWLANQSKVPHSEFKLLKDSTPREIFEVVDRITDEEVEHPASIRKLFAALTTPILEWYPAKEGKRSRSSSRSRSGTKSPRKVQFTGLRSPSPTPRPVTPERPSTPIPEWQKSREERGLPPLEPEAPATPLPPQITHGAGAVWATYSAQHQEIISAAFINEHGRHDLTKKGILNWWNEKTEEDQAEILQVTPGRD